jgi:hypothetical protein
VCVQSGYKTVTPIEIANCLQAHLRDELSWRGVRVFFACLAMVAVREAAARSRKRKGRKPCSAPRFQASELCRLTELSESAVKKEVRRLRKLEIITFTETGAASAKEPLRPENEEFCAKLSGKRSPRRPIPVPRAALRFIARAGKGALSKTLLAHIVRGLTLKPKTGEVSSAGTVKASWIARTFGISPRSVKAGRKELIRMGFISKDTGSFQRKLNRDGAYFRIDLSWTEPRSVKAGEGASPRISPRRAETRPVFAPPYKDRKTSYESKTQKTQSRALNLPGVCKATSGKPTLRDVRLEDLKRYSRLRLLFEDAVGRKWIQNSEASFLNWVAAAVRAQTTEARSPVRVFMAIVKQGRWELITQAQEDRARAAIVRNRKREEGERAPVFHGGLESIGGIVGALTRLNL